MNPKYIIKKIYDVLEKFQTSTQFLSSQKLKVYDNGTIIALEQYPNKDTFFGLRQTYANDVIQLIFKNKKRGIGVYLGVKIDGNVFLYNSTLRLVFGIPPEIINSIINTYDFKMVDSSMGNYEVIGFKAQDERIIFVKIRNILTKQLLLLYNLKLIEDFLETIEKIINEVILKKLSNVNNSLVFDQEYIYNKNNEDFLDDIEEKMPEDTEKYIISALDLIYI